MKIKYKLKMHLSFYLKQMEKSGKNKTVIEILKIILDENKNIETLKNEIPRLQYLSESINEPIRNPIDEADSLIFSSLTTAGSSLLNSPAASEQGINPAAPEKGNSPASPKSFVTSKMPVTPECYEVPEAIEALWLLGVCHQNGLGIEIDLKRAFDLFQLAALRGSALARTYLATCYYEGLGINKDLQLASKLYEQAAEQGNAIAMNYLGVCYDNGHGVKKDFKLSSELFQQAASKGFPQSIVNIGICYQKGEGVTQDIKRAIELFQQAAAEGSDGAKMRLGVFYLEGLHFVQDKSRAMEYFQQAADQGYDVAQRYLGNLYYHGEGVPKDTKRAAEFYEQAAAQDCADSQHMMGYLYRNGIGVAKDINRALVFYKQAADQGHAASQNCLGFFYQFGEGTELDLKLAAELYQLSAQQGDHNAQGNLANLYREGKYFAKDIKRAVELYQLSAMQGDTYHLTNMAHIYEEGIGVEKNLKRAGLLYQQAVKNGYQLANGNLEILKVSSDIPIPELEEALQYYSTQKDNSTLGFCYQWGMGTTQDFKQAAECYKQALQKNQPCCVDLYQCYQTMAMNGLDHETFQEFYKDVAKYASSADVGVLLRTEARLLLATLYERGAPYLDQNLCNVFKYFQLAIEENGDSINDDNIKGKRDRYAMLPAFAQHIKDVCSAENLFNGNNSIASLLAEYAFEPSALEPSKVTL